MHFDKTGYLPVNQVNSDFNKDKNVTRPDTSFRSHESDKPKSEENAKINSEMAKAYLGITTVQKNASEGYEAIKLVENKALSKEEAKKALTDIGFTEDDLNNVDFDNKDLLKNLSILDMYFRFGALSPDEVAKLKENTPEAKELKSNLISSFSEPSDEGVTKYLNEENIETLKKYINIETDDDLLVMAQGFGNPKFDKTMSLIGILSQNGKNKLHVKDFENLRYLDDRQLAAITPKTVEFVSKINSKIPKDNRIVVGSYCDLGSPEDLTDETAEQYINEINRLAAHNIEDHSYFDKNGIKGKIAEMKEISDFLDKNPIDFAKNEKGMTSSTVIKQFMERPDTDNVTHLLSLLTPEAKQTIQTYNFPKPDSEIPVEKWAELFNLISQKDMYEDSYCYSEVLKFIKENDIKDLDGIIGLIKGYQGTYANKYGIYIEKYLNVKNGDFENAAKVLNEAKTALRDLPPKVFDDFVTYQWHSLIEDSNTDFKKILDNIQKLNASDLKISSTYDLYNFMAGKSNDIFEKFELLKRNGFDTSDYIALNYVYNDENLSAEQLKNKINKFDEKLIKHFGTDTDIEILRYAANIKEGGSVILGTIRDNNEQSLEQAFINVRNAVKPENKSFYDALWNNEDSKVSKSEIASIARFVNNDNTEFAKKLCSDKDLDYNYNEISYILSEMKEGCSQFIEKLCTDKESDISKNIIIENVNKINKDNMELAEQLFTDKKLDFPKDKIADILKYTDSENLKLAKILCTDEQINIPKDEIAKILKNTRPEFLDFAQKLCLDKDLNFPKDKIADILKNIRPSNLELAERLCTDNNLDFPKEYISKLLQSNCTELISKNLDNTQFINDIKEICNSDENPSDLFIIFYNFKGKNSIVELSKTEKREFMEVLLANKNKIGQTSLSSNQAEQIPLCPKNTDGYVEMMKKISNSLNISIDPVSKEQTEEFNKAISKVSNYLKDADLSNLEEINLTMPHKEFISKVENLIKDLPKEEQIKIQDFCGFKIKDGVLSGYPNISNKSLELSDITDAKSIEAYNKLQDLIKEYTDNNFITVKDNPELNSVLKELSESVPEIFNQIDGTTEPIKMLKSLQKVVQNPEFDKLSDSDKKILTISTLLNNTDKLSGSTKESAFDAYFIAKKFNMTDEEAKKVYSIIESSNCIDEFMNTTRKSTLVFKRDAIIGQERQDKFDLIAFKLKEGNNYKLAQMLYSSKYDEGRTKYFDKILNNRIMEMKTTDFILPQTPTETYLDKAKQETVERGDEKYNVPVVHSEDIKDFYAYIHTPEAAFATGGTRDANFANFDAFSVLNDNKVICTSYVGNELAGLVKQYHHGFIFDVENDKQYVGFGKDIFSLAKNIPDMLVEYYRDRGFTANKGRGEKYEHRRMISNVLKSILYGQDYYNMSKDIDRKITDIKQKYECEIKDTNSKRKDYIINKFGTANISMEQFTEIKQDKNYTDLENQIKSLKKKQQEEIEQIPGYKDIQEMDKLYIERLDSIKSKLGNETMTLENIEKIDPEFAEAYRTFLKRNGTERTGEASLLRSDWHNEVLVSNPKISAIFTDNIESLPVEYLKKSQEENLPIVIVKT